MDIILNECILLDTHNKALKIIRKCNHQKESWSAVKYVKWYKWLMKKYKFPHPNSDFGKLFGAWWGDIVENEKIVKRRCKEHGVDYKICKWGIK